MTALLSQAIDTILAHTITVIEGDATHDGIPGVYSADEALAGTSPSALTITATGGSTTTVVDSTRTYAADRWVKTRAPSFYLLCATATQAANVDAARKISAWAQTTTTFTVANFPATVTAADTFYMLEGFRCVVDGSDTDAKADRRILLSLEPGEPADIYGAGNRTVNAELVAELSIARRGRHYNARKSALANAEILRSAIGLATNWESTYTRAVFADRSKIETEEDDETDRMVVTIRWPMLYRVALGYE